MLTRRRLLGGLTLAGLALSAPWLLSGCSSDPELIVADVPRAPLGELPESVRRMVNDLSGILVGRQPIEQNLICSPLSVAIVLAMVRNGAAGATADEMDRALGLPALEELNPGMNDILLTLESRSGERARPGGTKSDVTLSLAQQIWAAEQVAWQQAFLDSLARWYGAGIAPTDFTDPARATKLINDWVAEQTADKITEIVPPDAIAPETRMALANAIHLKAAWEGDFERTGTGPFRTHRGEVTVERMRRQALMPAYRGAAWTAVAIPYIGNELGMVVLQSPPGGEEALRAGLADGGLLATVRELVPSQVDLTMPLFAIKSQLDLKQQLVDLGMPTAFSDQADFPGMTTQEQLALTDVFHQGWIAVDEKGTEAAAATVALMGPTSAPVEVVTLVLDRPFGYAICDLELGVPILVGWVADPSQGA